MASKGDDWMDLPANEKELKDMFLKGKRHPSMKMAEIAIRMNRSPNQAFILLVGLSGAGKSSTINYLFDSENLAKINDDQSETRSTTEYTVTNKSPAWRIPKLPLSIIDTPGFNDTAGLEQDAKNLMTIKKFMKSHPNIRDCYPNLVMIVLSIAENRIKGEQSNFAKMLKGFKSINVVDYKNPNVVVVLTHAMSIARNPNKWKEMVECKISQVQDIVNFHLEISPEIVVQENLPEENELPTDGVWHVLPNGDKQPLTLFHACQNIMNKGKDEIGHEAVAVCFRPGMGKNVKTGISIPSSLVSEGDASAMYDILIRSIVLDKKSEVSNMLDQFKQENKVTQLQNDIIILRLKLLNLGILKSADLQSMSLNKLMVKLHPTRITKEMRTILKAVFGIDYEQSVSFDYNVGKGYNMFKDSATQFSALVMREDNKIQYGLPENVQMKECASLEMTCESIKNTKDYLIQRLGELNIDIGTKFMHEAFHIQNRATRNKETESCKFLTETFSIEHRTHKVEVTKPFVVSEDFKSAVQSLPRNYDVNNWMQWKAFFDKWGTHVVTGAFIGGSLTGEVRVVKGQSDTTTHEDTESALSMKIAFLQSNAHFDISDGDEQRTIMRSVSSVRSTFLNWKGGNSELYKNSLQNIEKDDWKAWIESLDISPVPLWNSLELYPLHQLANEVSTESGTQMQIAMNAALGVTYEQKEETRLTAAVSNDSGGCFHGGSFVLLHNRKMKKMKDLSVGAKILIIDRNGTLAQDEVIAWLHHVRNGQFKFLEIVHDNGKITLSPEHIIFVGKNRNPQQASTLRRGDELCFFTNDKDYKIFTMSTILSIHEKEGMGLFAPLTYSGRLLVDNVDVSCYCTLNPLQAVGREIISSHTLAHAGFFPLRLAFKFGLNVNNSQLDDESGIHGYARWLMKVILGK